MSELINVTPDNIAKEHICCAISDKKGENCVDSKKAWMGGRFKEGLVFKKLDERGKIFIEYMPAQNAWYPIYADGYMHINCFWVSGRFKGQGYANALLQSCVQDAREKGCTGVTVISSDKKRPFLSDPGYLRHKGFKLADKAWPYFELLYLPFADNATAPCFASCAKEGTIKDRGMVLYYTSQCPHTDAYAPLLQTLAAEAGETVKLIQIESKAQAQNAPCPFTTYSFFDGGRFITNEIFGEKKFKKYLEARANA